MNKIYKSREIYIGSVPLGGDNPVRIQSMTNTNTLDTVSTVKQVVELAKAGCDYVRIAARNIKEAENFKNIKQLLKQKFYDIPLIADIHFNPKIAETAVPFIDKIRINPGNFYDKNHNAPKIYSDSLYQKELKAYRQRIIPLLKLCKQHNCAIRIGTNAGSLSSRIVSRYGNTPYAMTEATLEFVRICTAENFHNLVLSIKASDVPLFIEANRLLFAALLNEGFDYPIHLGITEAGEGMDARIKSAAGIGSLLCAGIGDTIRVSLSENPVNEVEVCKYIINKANISPVNKEKDLIKKICFIGKSSPIYLKLSKQPLPLVITNNYNELKKYISSENYYFIDGLKLKKSEKDALTKSNDKVIICSLSSKNNITETTNIPEDFPVIFKISYNTDDFKELIINSTIDFTRILRQYTPLGIWINSEVYPQKLKDLALLILQANNLRFSKPVYIACPTCARTSFNLAETLKKVKAATKHLKGIKIAVMGCVVNGPGEMADADFGFIGSANGTISLYKGKTSVKKNIPQKNAVKELLNLINKEKK